MFGVVDYWALVIAVIVFLAIPGPGNLAIITATSKGGILGGLAATAGVIAGDQVLMWLAVAGVAALLTSNPAVFSLVQYAGAIYLAYLGVRMFLAQPGDAPILNMEARRFFRQSMLITLFNPKAIVFYMAFFPLVCRPGPAPGPLHLRRDGAHHRLPDLALLRDRHSHHPLRRRAHACESARGRVAQQDRRVVSGGFWGEAGGGQVGASKIPAPTSEIAV